MVISVGIVFSLSFEDVASLDALWRDYEEGEISDAMRKMLLSSDVDCSIRESVGSKSIEYRTRLFRDEFDRCRNELLAGDVASKTLNDRRMSLCLLRFESACQKRQNKECLSQSCRSINIARQDTTS